MIYVLLITAIVAFFVLTHELARRHRTRTYVCRERLRDIWRWRLSPLPRRRTMARKSVLEWWLAAHAVGGLPETDRKPTVEFGASLKHALAWADSSQLRIRVSEPWLRHLAWPDVHETMGHEVAHLVTGSYSPELRPHGPKWKKTMKILGLPPSVTYDAGPSPGQPLGDSGKADGTTEPSNPRQLVSGASRPATAAGNSQRSAIGARPHAGGRTRRPPRT